MYDETVEIPPKRTYVYSTSRKINVPELHILVLLFGGVKSPCLEVLNHHGILRDREHSLKLTEKKKKNVKD